MSSVQAVADVQVDVHQSPVMFLWVEPQHRQRPTPNEVPNAVSPGCSRGGDERQPFIMQTRKQIRSWRLPDLKTQLSTCTLLLVRIRNRKRSCFHSCSARIFRFHFTNLRPSSQNMFVVWAYNEFDPPRSII